MELFIKWLKLKVSILELEDEIRQLFWWLKIVQDNEKFENPPQFWKEAFNNNFWNNLLYIFDSFNGLAISVCEVERCHKYKHTLIKRKFSVCIILYVFIFVQLFNRIVHTFQLHTHL